MLWWSTAIEYHNNMNPICSLILKIVLSNQSILFMSNYVFVSLFSIIAIIPYKTEVPFFFFFASLIILRSCNGATAGKDNV